MKKEKHSTNIDLVHHSMNPNKVILILAWPAILEQLLQTFVSYVDTAMVGSIGVDATAAVAVNMPLTWMIYGILNGIGLGCSVIVAKKIGEQDLDGAKEAVRQSVILMALSGIAVFAIVEGLLAKHLAAWLGADPELIPQAQQYLYIVGLSMLFQPMLVIAGNVIRGTGNTRTPMFFNVVNNFINIFFNFLLIYPTRQIQFAGLSFTMWGAGMGVAGAAWGTTIAATVSGIFMLLALRKKDSPAAIRLLCKYRIDCELMKSIFVIAVPAAMERVIISCGQMISTGLATGLGNKPLAAHQLATTAESICYMPVSGISVAATTLVAQSLGAGDKKLASTYAKGSILFGLAAMAVSATLLFIFAPQLMSIFIEDAQVIAMGAMVLRVQAFAEPCLGTATISVGILKGAGDSKWSLYNGMIGMWAVRIPLAYIFVKFTTMGLMGLWVSMALDWVSRTIIALIRLKSGKWKDNWDVTA